MKISQSRQQEIRRERVEAVIVRPHGALFRRVPELAGFSIQQDLQPPSRGYSWPGYVAGEDLYREILVTLADLVEERTEAIELLGGRTFAGSCIETGVMSERVAVEAPDAVGHCSFPMPGCCGCRLQLA